jgi:hypothetical protein
VSHHLRALEAVELTAQRSCHRGIVEIDNAYRHLLGHTVIQQRGEEQHRQQREHHHTVAVNAIHIEDLTLTLGYFPYVIEILQSL